jgi:iron complex transport system ATP-binding protein
MSAPLLHARNVTVHLSGRAIVSGATLTLGAGELVVLVGPNGAGKTTLMRALAGLLPADGEIALHGKPLSALSPKERARAIAYLPQGHVFHWPMRADAIVALGRHPHADPLAAPSEADQAAVAQALAATGATALGPRLVSTLSGGERARIALARALATQAPILLADEPTAALDPRHQLVVMELLRATARAGGSVLAILHDLALAARFAARVIVMRDGALIADAPPADALSPARLAETFGVEAVMVDGGDGLVPLARRPI